jgi:hypothetical protein
MQNILVISEFPYTIKEYNAMITALAKTHLSKLFDIYSVEMERDFKLVVNDTDNYRFNWLRVDDPPSEQELFNLKKLLKLHYFDSMLFWCVRNNNPIRLMESNIYNLNIKYQDVFLVPKRIEPNTERFSHILQLEANRQEELKDILIDHKRYDLKIIREAKDIPVNIPIRTIMLSDEFKEDLAHGEKLSIRLKSRKVGSVSEAATLASNFAQAKSLLTKVQKFKLTI